MAALQGGPLVVHFTNRKNAPLLFSTSLLTRPRIGTRDVRMSEDFYCDEALSGRTPIEVVAETDEVLAFRHTRPFWPVHIVVIPKRHVPSLVDLGAADEVILHKVLAVVRRIADEVVTPCEEHRIPT